MYNIQYSGKYCICIISTLCWGNNSSILGGFQRGRSTVDQIFTMRQILEKCWDHYTDVHHLFIDFQAAVKLCGERKYGVKCIN